MEQEANKATWMGVTMTIIVTLVVAIGTTLTIGRSFGNEAIDKISKAIGVKGNELYGLTDTITKQSAASAQLLVCENFGIIDIDTSKTELKLRGDSEYTDLADIMTNAHGDVILEVRKEASWYIINVHEGTCNIQKMNGTCNCSCK